MKVTVYMAISANGMIAKKNDETPWSDEEWQSFNNKVKEIGNILIGRRTYELMKEDGSLDDLPCKLIMVLTSKNRKSTDQRLIFVSSFSEAVSTAEDFPFNQLLVGGGCKTITTVLNSKRVDEIYLDIEPWILDSGIPLVGKLVRNFQLKLIETKRIGSSGIQLHYKL